MTQAQAALSIDQVELSSGRFADVGLGLGSATGSYLSLSAQGSRLQAIKDSNGTTSSTLTAATTAMDALRSTASAFFASLTTAASSSSTAGMDLIAAAERQTGAAA